MDARGTVLPTSVGVFRLPARPGMDRGRPPHQRGGVPASTSPKSWPTPSSPPAWGCSDRRELLGPVDQVLPTSVGVFRPCHRDPDRGHGPPHQRGGVPKFLRRCLGLRQSSPPAWGCSGGDTDVTVPVEVLPTSVGVFRHHLHQAPLHPRPPHQRGGVPERQQVAGSERAVLPTSVGVFRRSPPRSCTAVGPPHQRGGVPSTLVRSIVLPTSVGVFRGSTSSSTAPSSPPHQRGGVPQGLIGPVEESESSPPAWGCSADMAKESTKRTVLPTSVGVLRSGSSGSCAPGRPPHQRGGVPGAVRRAG